MKRPRIRIWPKPKPKKAAAVLPKGIPVGSCTNVVIRNNRIIGHKP